MDVIFIQTTVYHTSMRVLILIIGGRGETERSKVSYISRKRISQFIESRLREADGRSRKGKQGSNH